MVIITYANKVINMLSEKFALSEKTCLQMPKSMV